MDYKTRTTLTENNEGKWTVSVQAYDKTVWTGGYYHSFGEACAAAERAIGDVYQMIARREGGEKKC